MSSEPSDPPVAEAPSSDPRQVRRVVLASFVGTTIEWYDYFLFGTAAALVFPHVFFPESSELEGTLKAFATYAVGFFARPVGGIIFGHFGDRIGRKAMLVTTLTMMGVATFLIGLLPSFSQIGIVGARTADHHAHHSGLWRRR